MDDVKERKLLLKKIGNISFYVVLGIVLVYAVFALFSKKEENQVSFFGITSLAVQSPSMSGTFEEGDLIFIDTNFDLDDVINQDGDEGVVITYWDSTLESYNTHRIIEVDPEANGVYFLTTKGDANPEADSIRLRVSENELDDIVGIWHGRTWGGFGSFVDGFTNFIKSSLGFFLLIVVPAILFLGYEVYRFIKVYGDYNRKKGAIDREALKQQAIEEAKRQLEEERKNKE